MKTTGHPDLDFYRNQLRSHAKWALKSMMGVSLLYLVFIIPFIPLKAYPKGILLTTLYGLCMAIPYWLCFAIGLKICLVYRSKKGSSREFEPGLLFHLIVACIGVNVGIVPGEYLKFLFYGKPLVSENLLIYGIEGCLIGMLAAFFNQFRHYKSKFQRIHESTIEAQYLTLKNQMQPHFLYNSLNSLAELMEIDKKNAVKMTLKLSDLYREILASSKQKTSTLASELSIVRKYLELERLRYEDRLSFEIAEPKDSEKIFLPSLILQTLVENAVKHGIARSAQGGSIQLEVKPTLENLYQLEIKNSGGAYTPELREGTGLSNTRERLQLFYGDINRFSIQAHSDGQTVVSFYFSGEAFA